MKKALILFLTVMIFLSGCANRDTIGTSELLGKLLSVSGEDIEGNGEIYYLSAEEGELGYFSEDDRKTMYGEEWADSIFFKIEDCSVFVSSRELGELAVFKCRSRSDTDEVAKMCLSRAKKIKTLLRNGEWGEKSQHIKVLILGKFVVFCFVNDPLAVERKLAQIV